MAFCKYTSMELDDEDKLDLGICCGPYPESKEPEKLIPQFPWGLRICFTAHELKRLELDPSDVKAGDVIHMKVFARITNISTESMRHSRSGEIVNSDRVELQIEQIAAEDEDNEDAEDNENDE